MGSDPVNATDPSGLQDCQDCRPDDIPVNGTRIRDEFGNVLDMLAGLITRDFLFGDIRDRDLRQQAADAAKAARRPQKKLTVFKGRPPGSKICSAYGQTFFAPAGFDPGKIVAAGKSGGLSLSAINAAVGFYGKFDFQRSRDRSGNTTFYSQYRFVSNVAVGLYMQGTGSPEIIANAIEDTYAHLFSSSAGDSVQIQGQEVGWDAGNGDISISCDGGK